jgi:hypothetical protein
MAAKKTPNVPQEKLELYDKLIATHPDLERKGAANPYLSLNGHMLSYLHATGSVALKLPPVAREVFLAKYNTKLFEAYGVVQRDFVTVPDDLLERTEELAPYLVMSYDYVKTLKPKPPKPAQG